MDAKGLKSTTAEDAFVRDTENKQQTAVSNQENFEAQLFKNHPSHNAQTLASLSREALESLVLKLEGRLNPPPNDWHSLFYALLMIELHDKPSVRVEREILLGAQPPRADFLILEEDGLVDLGLSVFRTFRQHNIIEFKSPNDHLNLSTLWKTVGYAGFYISLKKISAETVTLTLIRGTKPEKLLREMASFIEPDSSRGIYHIRNWKVDLPIQIIVTTELEGKNCAGFRVLSKQPRVEDLQQILYDSSESASPDAARWYRAFLDLYSKLDNAVLEEAKRRSSEMGKTLVDIFRPEIEQWANERAEEIANEKVEKIAKERAEKWKAQSRLMDLYTYVQKGGMTVDFAAGETQQSRDEFLEDMKKAGFRVPGPTA